MDSFNYNQLSYISPEMYTNDGKMSQSLAAQYQQLFLAGGPPTLVVTPSNIPLYPCYQTIGQGNSSNGSNSNQTKYQQLLAVIEEMSKDVRPIYSGSKTAVDRFKRGITHARVLIRECILETERSNNKQQ